MALSKSILSVLACCRGSLAISTSQSLRDGLRFHSQNLLPVIESPTHNENGTVSTSALFGRQNDIDDDGVFDQTDLSFISSMAAIGDSYSAGIGAGDRLGSFLDVLNPESGMWMRCNYPESLFCWEFSMSLMVHSRLCLQSLRPRVPVSREPRRQTRRPSEKDLSIQVMFGRSNVRCAQQTNS